MIHFQSKNTTCGLRKQSLIFWSFPQKHSAALMHALNVKTETYICEIRKYKCFFCFLNQKMKHFVSVLDRHEEKYLNFQLIFEF